MKPTTLLAIEHPLAADLITRFPADEATLQVSIVKATKTADGSESKAPALKPPLKWAGGKRWLLPFLQPLWLPHSSRRYVDPFCGGLAIPLGLRPKTALLNDINPHLINFYVTLQRGLNVNIRMKNDEASFYVQRTRFNELVRRRRWQSAEAAQLFYY